LGTYSARKGEVERKWWLVDASGQTLGRLASRVATILQGKNKPTYTAHIDTGDFVVVINVDRIRISGRKLEQKEYFRHTGYPGGQKTTQMKEMFEKHPERVLMHAVKGMMPKNRLGRAQLRKLKIYAGAEHPHEAQQPEILSDAEIRRR
jgi:large subunit ribosomal protein L13